MTVCLDANVFLQILGPKHPFHPILRALLEGRLVAVVSTAILLEYEEITTRFSGHKRWEEIAALLEILARLHGNILYSEPQFRFGVIISDSDDNKFCDCAIASEADYVVTQDHHFEPLRTAGYKSQPIRAEEFIRLHLSV
jgi:putative PIN family toxin of toxin-antitoxin system